MLLEFLVVLAELMELRHSGLSLLSAGLAGRISHAQLAMPPLERGVSR
jgi:hypothetical protein